MHVSVELPDPKTGLDAALAKQFAELQRQLMGLVKDQASSRQELQAMMFKGLQSQQQAFVEAIDKVLGMVGRSLASSKPSEAMVEALQGLRTTVAALPETLKTSLDTQFKVRTTVTPSSPTNVTVQMPEGLLSRMDALHAAMVNGMRRSHHRTFGSNY